MAGTRFLLEQDNSTCAPELAAADWIDPDYFLNTYLCTR